MTGYVYIVASKPRGTLYIGVTGNIAKRAWEHKERIGGAFASQNDCTMLVWYELHDTVPQAIAREKRLKKWLRTWKIELIENMNPHWADLFDELNG